MPRGSNFTEYSRYSIGKQRPKFFPSAERCVDFTALPEDPRSDLRSHRISPFSPTIVIQVTA
jgi:hypothetical protein